MMNVNLEVKLEVDSVAALLSQEEVIDYESDEVDTFPVSSKSTPHT